jgi:hypothetical protein
VTVDLRLLDAEWLDSIEGAPRIEAAISAFRARCCVVETEERNVGSECASDRRGFTQ